MLDKSRHKRVRAEGCQARLNGSNIESNPYSKLGVRGQTYASLWDAGWVEADKKSCAENFRPIRPAD